VWAVSDPVSLQQAEEALRCATGFDRYRAAGQIVLLAGSEWYLRGDKFDLQRITGDWNEKLSAALCRAGPGGFVEKANMCPHGISPMKRMPVWRNAE
jgi:hypothetical protein